MSKKVAPRVQLNFAEEDIIEDEPPCDLQDMPDMPVDMPEVVERDQIVENDIFDLKKKEHLEELIINEVADEEEEVKPTPQPLPKPKKKQQATPAKATQQKKKRQLSEEHKAKLALAREKALVTRRKKAEEKKKMKEIENKTKELRKKKAQKDLEELEDEVIHDKPSKSSPVQKVQTFTKEDLENASLEAIMKYEAIRKARKEEKRKVQMIEKQKQDLQKKIQGYGARDPNGRLLNKWDRCY